MSPATRILTGPLMIGAMVDCAAIPSPPSESLIQVTQDNGVRVIAPTFELDFAATGLHMPEHLMVNGVDVLGVDDPCQGESRIGILVSPAVQASASASAGSSEITVLAAGPAMAKVRVTYDIGYKCPSDERMTGATVFTILPSGRIVREDLEVKPSTNPLGMVGNCGCQQETNVLNFRKLYFSSFWAFDPVGATQIDPSGNAIDKDAADQVYQACTRYNTHAIGVAWTPLAGTSARIHSNQAASHTLHFPTINDHLMLEPTAQSMTSAIQIAATPLAQASDCGKVIALLADVKLTIGAMAPAYTAYDGIYRDSAIHNEAFDIVAGNEAVPAGFAISVDLGGADHAVITRQDGAEQPAVAQREAGSRFLIFFKDGLAPGERLTIEPRR